MSGISLLGRILQYAGMAVMFFGFVLLVMNVQKTISSVTSNFGAQAGVQQPPKACDPKDDPACGVDLNQPGAMEEIFSRQTNEFIFYLGAGLGLILFGLLFRAGDEISGALGGFLNKDKSRSRIPVGKARWREPGEGIGGFGGAGFGGFGGKY